MRHIESASGTALTSSDGDVPLAGSNQTSSPSVPRVQYDKSNRQAALP